MENSASPPRSTGEVAEGRDLKQLLAPVRRRWKLVLLVALLIGGAAYVYYHREAPTYTATTNVYLQPSSLQSSLLPGAPPVDPSRASENQAHLVLTPGVARLAARELHFKGDPLTLLPLVEAIPDPESDFLAIQATAADPQGAADVANAFAAGLVRLGTGRLRREAEQASAAIENRLAELPRTRDNKVLRHNLRHQLEQAATIETVPPGGARHVSPAVPPSTPNGPSPKRNAIFAGILGLILGALLAHGLEGLRRRLPSSHAEEAYALPVLASVPFDRRAAIDAQRGPGLPAPLAEPVRTLRTALDHGADGGPPPSILITSAIQGEGKSIVTKSLALGFFHGGARTLLIDGDLRRPSLHRFFDVEPEPGLSDLLRSGAPLEEFVRPILLEDEIDFAHEAALVPVETDPTAAEATELALGQPSEGNNGPGRRAAQTRSGHWRRGNRHERVDNGADRAPPPMEWLSTLDLLPAGSPTADPAALLGTPAMARLLSEAVSSYDVVLVDSSPLLAVSDAIPLAKAVDGVVVVTRSDYTTIDAAQSLRRALERLPDVSVIGLVANGVRDSSAHHYRYRYAGAE